MSAAELTYRAGGVDVGARLYRPDDVEAPAPGVLLCPGRLRDIDGLAFLSEALARAGHVVLATRYRGMDFAPDDEDARGALAHLASLEEVDEHRIAAVGHSRGGMCVLRVAASDDRVRAVVALAPPTDFDRYVRAMELLSPVRYGAMVEAMGGTPDEAPDRYARISAVRYGGRIRVPTLLVCGTQDLHAPVDHSVWMRDAILAGGNRDCELVTLDGVGHFFERMYHGYEFDRVSELTGNWLSHHLSPGGEMP